MSAGEFTGGTARYSPEMTRLIGVGGAIFFGGAIPFIVWRGLIRRWSVVLSPSGLVAVLGSVRRVVPWESMSAVTACEHVVATHGMDLYHRYVGIVAENPEEISGDKPSWFARRRNEWFGVHVLLPSRGLAVRPLLLYYAVRYYHEHPEARAELGGEEGVQRIRRGELHDVADVDTGNDAPVLSDSDSRHT